METAALALTRFVRVDDDIVDVARGGEETIGRTGTKQLLVDDLVKQLIGIVEELASGFSKIRVFKNARELTFELPSEKERRPVDVFAKFGERSIARFPSAKETGFRNLDRLPVRLK